MRVMPAVRYFRDRPRPDAVRLCAYWPNAHFFVFHWGATMRYRTRGNQWRHISGYAKARQPGKGRGFEAQLVTWLTDNGVTQRIPLSKRYIGTKTLFGPTSEDE